MNNIANHFPVSGSSRQNSLPTFHASTYEKEMAVRARESASTDLVIRTNDGDLVTLSSSSYSQMDAYMYSSEGLLQTESGSAYYSLNHREITLASGQSFSFSVAGDLSEEELEDIEAIVKGLDDVMEEMQQGDMSEAMEKALDIGTFDTITSYSADLTLARSYEMRSAAAAASASSTAEQVNQAENEKPRLSFDNFFSKLLKQLQAHEERLVGLARNPIDKLFKHHLDDIDKNKAEPESLYSIVERAMEEMSSLIDELQDKESDN